MDLGYDSPADFDKLSIAELKGDIKIKPGHIKKVSEHRGAAISEAVPPAPTRDLHRHSSSSVATVGGGPERRSVALDLAKLDATQPFLGLPNTIVIFGSMRFPVPPEMRELFAALLVQGVYLKIVDMTAGAIFPRRSSRGSSRQTPSSPSAPRTTAKTRATPPAATKRPCTRRMSASALSRCA